MCQRDIKSLQGEGKKGIIGGIRSKSVRKIGRLGWEK